jgi:hypothetical protein
VFAGVIPWSARWRLYELSTLFASERRPFEIIRALPAHRVIYT